VASGSAIRARVFVVGVPRSGTTLLQSLLAAHSATTSFTESHFFSRHFSLLPLLGAPVLVRDPAPRVAAFLAENGETPPDAAAWFAGSGGRALRVPPLRPFVTRAASRRLVRVLDELASRRGKPVWIEKTPRHLRYGPFLLRLCGPGTHVVHLIRDGLEAVASLRAASQRWERPYDLAECVRRWNADVAFSLGRVGAPSHHFVFYEDLTTRPEAVLPPLLSALGLPWEPEVLEGYGDASRGLVTAEESWKSGVTSGIRPSGTSGHALTADEREAARRGLRTELYEALRRRTGATAPRGDA
jgi:hypothetical protein